VKFEIRDVGLKEDGIEKFRAHVEILQGRSEAYSSWSEKFVNGCDECGIGNGWNDLAINVDSKVDSRKHRSRQGFSRGKLCGKAEEGGGYLAASFAGSIGMRTVGRLKSTFAILTGVREYRLRSGEDFPRSDF
jgi:hypothetical protein